MSANGEQQNGAVTYTVKELLAKIEGKLDGVIITIGQKADKHDVEEISGRVKDKADKEDVEKVVSRVMALEDRVEGFDSAARTAEQVALTLAEKKKADETLWEQWRAKLAWCLGLLVAVATFHSAFPHLF